MSPETAIFDPKDNNEDNGEDDDEEEEPLPPPGFNAIAPYHEE